MSTSIVTVSLPIGQPKDTSFSIVFRKSAPFFVPDSKSTIATLEYLQSRIPKSECTLFNNGESALLVIKDGIGSVMDESSIHNLYRISGEMLTLSQILPYEYTRESSNSTDPFLMSSSDVGMFIPSLGTFRHTINILVHEASAIQLHLGRPVLLKVNGCSFPINNGDLYLITGTNKAKIVEY